MDRAQFMSRLETLLSDVPETERREALEYFDSYFEEAGREREAEVLLHLGSPEEVAVKIRDNVSENDKLYGEYTENGYRDYRTDPAREVPEIVEEGFREKVRRNPVSFLILAVILAVFLSPFLGIIKGIVIVLLIAAAVFLIVRFLKKPGPAEKEEQSFRKDG